MRGAGVTSAPAEARWLLAHVLGTSGADLLGGPLMDRGRVLDESQRAAFWALVQRRTQREPLQHLLGRAAFRSLDLRVGPGVFVPRPETELLIDLVAPRLSGPAHPTVVDLCAGSGALGLSAAVEFRPRAVVLVERSAAALSWLRANVADARTSAALTVVAADVTDPAVSGPAGALGWLRAAVDVVVCNPPYVPLGTTVGPEVHHDPAGAVYAGADGMDLMAPVIALARELLVDGGVVGIEHDESRRSEVLDCFAADGNDTDGDAADGDDEDGWRTATGHRDLTGRPRFVTATRVRPG